VGFEESDFSELIHARKVAKFLGTDHYEQIVNPEIIPEITELIHHYDEPYADSSMLPTFLVCKHARQHVTVALSGDGGDEVFGGYARYRYETQSDQLLRIPGVRLFANALSVVYPRHWRGYVPLVKMRYAGGARYAEQLSIFHTRIRTALYKGLNHAASRKGAQEFIERNYWGSWNDCPEPLSRMQRVDILKGWLPGDMLTKVDMASMRASLEVRCPLLDQRLIEYMARVPARFKIRGNVTKYLLKKIGERLVPPEVLYRPKQGFSLPLKHWFRQNLKGYIESNLMGPDSVVVAVFRREAIKQVLDDHVHRSVDNSERIFALLALEIWLRGKTSNPKHAVDWIRHSQVNNIEKHMAVHG
jgi:asparagine synthase (glutamine-hydrolysing)